MAASPRARQPLESKFCLGGRDGSLQQWQGCRGDGIRTAGDVDHPENHTRVRIMNRNRGATPRMNDAREVLSALNLDPVVERQCLSWCVRAHRGLGPVRPLEEVHALGFSTHGPITVNTYQSACSILPGN